MRKLLILLAFLITLSGCAGQAKAFETEADVANALKENGIACDRSWTANFFTATGKYPATECTVVGNEDAGTWVRKLNTDAETAEFVKYLFNPDSNFTQPGFDFKVIAGNKFVVHASYFEDPQAVAQLLGGVVVDSGSFS
ncbi:hypothetical protein SAMN05216276_1008155 [Streptosporangium subroseum]|uniref:Uncharacterized protein n=1 Tax=Streptosporangium subroseum TaxID=106412 RepID=A0A239E114_9ACTN|nr:hypothetical protein [Streptosporangium subroseum]SNS37958.1 hypothetical protein SAMN05216276_1008155 [Streptosporangium subroseum]